MGWKKSKPLMALLVVVIVIVWIYLFFLRGSGAGGGANIEQAFYDTETNQVVVMDEHPGGFPPYENPETGKRTLWDAYTNTEATDPETGEPPIFPQIVKYPEGMTPPAAGEEPDPRFLDFMMRATEMPPICPVTKSRRNVTRYYTPEAKKKIEELRQKYAN